MATAGGGGVVVAGGGAEPTGPAFREGGEGSMNGGLVWRFLSEISKRGDVVEAAADGVVGAGPGADAEADGEDDQMPPCPMAATVASRW